MSFGAPERAAIGIVGASAGYGVGAWFKGFLIREGSDLGHPEVFGFTPADFPVLVAATGALIGLLLPTGITYAQRKGYLPS